MNIKHKLLKLTECQFEQAKGIRCAKCPEKGKFILYVKSYNARHCGLDEY